MKGASSLLRAEDEHKSDLNNSEVMDENDETQIVF
jgi:hypothetical protein